MPGISKVLKPRFTPIFTKHNIKHMVAFSLIAFLGALLVSNYYDAKALQIQNDAVQRLGQEFLKGITTGETIDLKQEVTYLANLTYWDLMCHYLTYDKNVGLTLYLVCIFIAYAFIYRHLNALGEKRGVRFEVKQEEKKIGLVIVQAISLEEYDRQAKEYTAKELRKLQQSQEYKEMLKKKKRMEENWNWQVRQRKYGVDEPNLARQKKAGDEFFESPSKETTPQKKVYLLRSNTDSQKKQTRSLRMY